MARRIADDHGMVVKGNPFLDDRHYFLYHADEQRSRRHKRDIHSRLESHPDVEWFGAQRAKRRSKRDYVYSDAEVSHGISKRDTFQQTGNRSSRQAQQNLPIPHLPWPDPLYQDQWYLVSFAVLFLIFYLSNETNWKIRMIVLETKTPSLCKIQ